MPVTIQEFVKITDVDGQTHEGVAVATNLVAIKDGEETRYGVALGVTKVRVKVVCDNEKCENSQVSPDFVTQPKTIEFDESGEDSAKNVKEIADIIVVSDYQGKKLTFCTSDCYAAYVRRSSRDKITPISSGKGAKTTFTE